MPRKIKTPSKIISLCKLAHCRQMAYTKIAQLMLQLQFACLLVTGLCGFRENIIMTSTLVSN